MPSSIAETERVIECLSGVRLCQGLDREQLAAIARELSVRTFVAGETLASAGDPVSEFWIVIEGEIDTFLTDPRGREKPLGTVRQGETVGEVIILEKSTTRPVRFTARTHGTLLVAPAELLQEWIQTHPQIMQNLFFTLSERFKVVTGAASRKIPSPRLGIVACSAPGFILAGRLAAKLRQAGESLQIWANQPARMSSTVSWPQDLPIQSFTAGDAPLLKPVAANIDRQIVCCSPGTNDVLDYRALQGCDEILWLLDPRDAAHVVREIASLSAVHSELPSRVRVVWLLNSDCPVAPLLSGPKFQKRDIKVFVGQATSEPNRQEIQGVARLARALRGISIGIALAGGGAKGMAHFGVLQTLEEAGITFDVMSGTSAGAMAGILYASGMSP
jgi:NTE family protein